MDENYPVAPIENDADFTLIDVVDIRTATITYHTEHGVAPEPYEVELDEFGEHPLQPSMFPTLEAEGYNFKGWTYANGNMANVNDFISEDIELYAVWEEAPTTVDYTITYQTAYGTTPAFKTITVPHGESYVLTSADLPALTSSSKVAFIGWVTDPKIHNNMVISGTDVEEGYVINGNITLTAVWRPLAIITYHSEHGAVPTPLTVQLDAFHEIPWEEYMLPQLSAPGWIFKGWADEYGSEPMGFLGGDVDLYAIWEKVPDEPGQTESNFTRTYIMKFVFGDFIGAILARTRR